MKKFKIEELINKVDISRSKSFGSYVGAKTLQAYLTALLLGHSIKNERKSKLAIPFTGMASEIFYLLDDFDEIFANDADPYLINFLNCLKDPQKLLDLWAKEMKPGGLLYHGKNTAQEASNYYRELWELWKQKVTNFSTYQFNLNNPDYELAMIYKYVLLYTYNSMSSNIASFRDHYTPARLEEMSVHDYKPAFLKEIKRISDPILQRAAKKIKLSCMDAVDFISQHDSKDTAFIIDPPYFNCDTYYTATFNMDDHYRLAKAIQDIKGLFVYNNYDNHRLHNWFPANKFLWLSESFPKSSGKGVGQEIFITNADKNKFKFSDVSNMSRSLTTIFFQVVIAKLIKAYKKPGCKLARVARKNNKRMRNVYFSEEFKRLCVRLIKDKLVTKKSLIEEFQLSYYFLTKWECQFKKSSPLIKQYHHIAVDAIHRGCNKINYNNLKDSFMNSAYKTNYRNSKICKLLGIKNMNLCSLIQPIYEPMAA